MAIPDSTDATTDERNVRKVQETCNGDDAVNRSATPGYLDRKGEFALSSDATDVLYLRAKKECNARPAWPLNRKVNGRRGTSKTRLACWSSGREVVFNDLAGSGVKGKPAPLLAGLKVSPHPHPSSSTN